ncbi:5716_t:CDS:2 [Funneliformis geosporum]|uniref:5716_t:CDS:1 n=1 Tax=Funneliformis geosporum TaxID=1117311 RepID=A0A9W4T257_9GLOM|nr:5716_t:CDS:2 [Funneliformis geosporum]
MPLDHFPLQSIYEKEITANVFHTSYGLLFAINDNNLLGVSTKHRLKLLQQREWLASSPLLCWPYATPSKDSD